MSVIKLTDLDIRGKRVLIREDLNVPVKDARITSDQRLRAALPTIHYALAAGAKVMLMSHLGRPPEGTFTPADSLRPVAQALSALLGKPVPLVTDYLDKAPALNNGEVVLFENVRFNPGEKANSDALATAYAALCDIYVMDAFGSAHRAEASTHGVGRVAAVACAGILLAQELEALATSLAHPRRPLAAIVGGAKVSTKLTVLENLAQKVDQLIVGGGIANTFIAAAGFNVGTSLYEVDLIETAKRLLHDAKARGAEIPIPTDVVVAKEFAETARATTKPVSEVGPDEMILDIGPQTARHVAQMLTTAGTIVWNGPVGVFEFDQFGEGTKALAHAIAASPAFSIAGGGDTLAAVAKYQIGDRVSYISTGGGAFLEFLEGKKLPAVEMLEQRA